MACVGISCPASHDRHTRCSTTAFHSVVFLSVRCPQGFQVACSCFHLFSMSGILPVPQLRWCHLLHLRFYGIHRVQFCSIRSFYRSSCSPRPTLNRSALTGQEYVLPSRSIFEGKLHRTTHAPRGEYGIGRGTENNKRPLVLSRPSDPLLTTASANDSTYWKYPRSTVLGVAAMQTLGLLMVIVAVLFARRRRQRSTGSSSSPPSSASWRCSRWQWIRARSQAFMSPRTI